MGYREAYTKWLNDADIDQSTKDELRAIAGNEREIEDRFFRELEFGTGGLRGVLGAGSNRLNIYTIRRATQGLANYILKADDYKPGMGVVIAHDSRHMSPEFTMETALVFNANGIKTFVFDSLRPTPVLSYAVRHLGCIAGIVITASHNPPEYNGYKVYWSDGGQCTYPRDNAIIDEVNNVTDFSMVKKMPKAQAVKNGLYNIAPADVDDMYIANVKSCCQNPSIIAKSDIKIVFTPLHGAGNVPVRRVLEESGFKHVYVVAKQELPNGDFPTVSSPNPEDSDAYSLALELAGQVDADVIIATDPDADRVGVAVKHNNKHVILTGNMVGSILTEYLLSQMQANGRLPQNSAIISTIVSSDMGCKIAKSYGATYLDVLTGFKYIGEKMNEFEESGTHTFVFGYEESYGYLTGTYARDKDAVVASLLVCEAAAHYKLQGLTLYDVLLQLYKKHGLHLELTTSLTMKGTEGLQDIQRIMASLRTQPPTSLGGSVLVESRDYLNKRIKYLHDGREEATSLPISDVLYFTTKDGSWACIRPSGTEPKIKLYFGICLPPTATMEDASAKLTALADDMKSNITPVTVGR
ncbi:MAG: phospho-sugar mutase [Defluviitaleaceae bacterium]|nr:phospho-sugar mutase [Defluviitaleaceae bacterium]